MEKQALILFTRLPMPGTVKTRLMPQLDGAACADLQWALLADLAPTLRNAPRDIFVFYTPEGQLQELRRLQELLDPASYIPQQGSDLGQRMQSAFKLVFSQGYTSVLLLGSDIPLVSSTDIATAWQVLSSHDVVFGPSTDGGYWLVGLKQIFPLLFQQTHYGHGQVLEEAQAICAAQDLSVGFTSIKGDIDVWEDLEYFRQMVTHQGSPALYEFIQDLFGIDG